MEPSADKSHIYLKRVEQNQNMDPAEASKVTSFQTFPGMPTARGWDWE